MTTTTIELDFERLDVATMRARAAELRERLPRRRSVRAFSPEPPPIEVVRSCIEVAATAPSGANKQPWTFCLVTDPELKRAIRRAAEKEEQAFYGGRAPESWLADLEPLGTDARKTFLETAPALIVVFARLRGEDGPDGERGGKHYYVRESVGIAVGFLIAALHLCGLATLTHTPSPMRFLAELLDRPSSERAYLLLPVGYPAGDHRVPDIRRRALAQTLIEYGESCRR